MTSPGPGSAGSDGAASAASGGTPAPLSVTDPGEHDAYVLDEEVTVVVVTTDDGDRYVLRDTAVHRAEMAAAFGPDSEEATQLDESVHLTADLRVRLGIGLVALWDYTGHREGPIDDRRGRA